MLTQYSNVERGVVFIGIFDFEEGHRRKAFKISTKKKEWNKAAGRSELDFKSTSKCRNCRTRLTWGSGKYDFDHKDNNPANNSQRNCYLVCKNCHGGATKIGRRKVSTFGFVDEYETFKKRVSYKKKPKKKKKTKRRRKTEGFGIFEWS